MHALQCEFGCGDDEYDGAVAKTAVQKRRREIERLPKPVNSGHRRKQQSIFGPIAVREMTPGHQQRLRP